jgi:hypothetical protein
MGWTGCEHCETWAGLCGFDALLYTTSTAPRRPAGVVDLVLCCAVLCARREFSDMSDAQQEALLMQKANLVFSRAEPKHKQVR